MSIPQNQAKTPKECWEPGQDRKLDEKKIAERVKANMYNKTCHAAYGCTALDLIADFPFQTNETPGDKATNKQLEMISGT